jgi:WD40 repeat protein
MQTQHQFSPKELETSLIGPLFKVFDLMVLTQTASPDGRYLATANLTVIKLWDLGTGRQVRWFGGREVVPATALFSPDGRWLLAGRQDGGVRVWDVATGTVLADLPLHEAAVTALTFSPDGKRLATGSADTTVLVWDWAALRNRVAAARPNQQ